VKSVLDHIGAETLLQAFRGYGGCGYRNLVYFAACNVLCGSEGEKFARDFLTASRSRAVIGYTTNVDWMQSLVTDMLFLQRFYMFDFILGTHPITTKGTTQLGGGAERRSAFDV
jgi:hypothetical protein